MQFVTSTRYRTRNTLQPLYRGANVARKISTANIRRKYARKFRGSSNTEVFEAASKILRVTTVNIQTSAILFACPERKLAAESLRRHLAPLVRPGQEVGHGVVSDLRELSVFPSAARGVQLRGARREPFDSKSIPESAPKKKKGRRRRAAPLSEYAN